MKKKEEHGSVYIFGTEKEFEQYQFDMDTQIPFYTTYKTGQYTSGYLTNTKNMKKEQIFDHIKAACHHYNIYGGGMKNMFVEIFRRNKENVLVIETEHDKHLVA